MTTVPADVLHDLAPTGRLRTTINLGNPVLARQDADGTLGGVSVELAQGLAGRLGVGAELFPFATAGEAFAALVSGRCDAGFLAIDPVRGEALDYTAPYVIIEGTYLVPDASPMRDADEVDRDGIRIAAERNAAYDLYLTRTLRHARIVRAPTAAAAAEMLLAGEAEALAGVREALVAEAAAHAGLRVMPGRFLAIQQAMALPKGHLAGRAYLHGFIEEMKASGTIAAALARNGQAGAIVAPPWIGPPRTAPAGG